MEFENLLACISRGCQRQRLAVARVALRSRHCRRNKLVPLPFVATNHVAAFCSTVIDDSIQIGPLVEFALPNNVRRRGGPRGGPEQVRIDARGCERYEAWSRAHQWLSVDSGATMRKGPRMDSCCTMCASVDTD
eukprot:scaffold141924_cov23-Tisochrysis_lutea.AAC.6